MSANIHNIDIVCMDLPRAKCPVVALHGVRDIGGVRAGQMVVEISLGLW